MTELSADQYEKLLKPLTKELSAMARWVAETGQRIVVLFEGRDTAGKGGSIDMIARVLNPRQCHVIALSSPNERERAQWYFQRYAAHLPPKGEIALFDRSWYNRAGVERVMGFCTDDQADRFLLLAPLVEQAIVDSGVILLKYWLEVDEQEQTRRLEGRIDDGRKTWKLSPMDLKSYSRWYDYSRARDEMFKATDTAWAPWYVVRSDDKKKARLNLITHLLSQIPYKELPQEKIELPKRQKPGDYEEPDYPFKFVKERF